MTALPKLRALDFFPVRVGGQTHVVARDPEGICEETLVMTPATAMLAMLMDGTRDVAALARAFAEQTGGVILRPAEVEGLIEQLETRALLDGETYARRVAQLDREFAALEARPAVHAGGVYPAEAGKLVKVLDGYYRKDGAAPWPGDGAAGRSGCRIAGVISPHIDYPRGGYCYTHAFAPLVGAQADVWVIIGVAHAGARSPFVVCDKPFDTPLGRAEIAREVMDQLRARAPSWAFENARVHLREHSVELPLVFLLHAVGAPVRIVPVLCGSLEAEAVACGGAPRTQGVEEFLGALSEALEPVQERAVIVCGADLAHIGPRFGDDRALTRDFVQWMEQEDAKSLARVEAGDADGWYASVVADGNKRKVCGLGAVYAFLRLLGGRRGEVRRYGYAPDPAGGIVSFASVVFPR